MKDSNVNIKFEYLYRDAENYKQFGELIFPNPTNISVKNATFLLKQKLIDSEYFYPSKAGIRKLNVCSFEFELEWYEFSKFSNTTEAPTETINIETFISDFKSK